MNEIKRVTNITNVIMDFVTVYARSPSAELTKALYRVFVFDGDSSDIGDSVVLQRVFVSPAVTNVTSSIYGRE